ncbi:hypothetical protein RND81_02G042300 [Saponaria officinalis]|uniref:Uncharacterized protein n=1 Tax=Saponaria officinalis TaxID=3572 RepID=A0AAW1MMP5_SAPOF
MAKSVEEPVWIVEVRQVLEDATDEGLDRPPCVFTVPKTLKYVRPEAYEPQLLALGPYHRWRDDLYEMERLKVLTAKKVQALFPGHKFEDIIRSLAMHAPRIRARYDKHLKMSAIELAWMMAIDGLFILQFLYTFGSSPHESVLNLSPRLSVIVDSKSQQKPSYDCLVKDVMMLENQVPINVLKKILEVQCPSSEFGLNLLANMYLAMCKKNSPFKIRAEHPLDGSALKRRGHLLGFYYSLINRMWDQEVQLDQAKAIEIEELDGGDGKRVEQKCGLPFCNMDHRSPIKVFGDLWESISKLSFFKKGPFKVLGVVKDLVSNVVSNISGENSKGASGEGEKITQVEEIVIPSVSSLVKAGIELKPTDGGFFSIRFDKTTQTLHLPVVKLDVNSEVIIRNLVAYEALAISGPLVIAHYAELMNGIVDTEEDARMLKERGIIQSELKNGEIADLWNGMSKCIRLTRVEFIDKAIEGLNGDFNGLRTVKIYRMGKAYVYGSWKMLVFLATILVIALMCLQSFCSVYNCPRFFHLESAEK